MVKQVIKRNGTTEEFTPEKLNKWAQYATKTGGNWSEIAIATYKRLPDLVRSSDIHQTMINVCLDKEDIKYSRIAARLMVASIRKNMDSLLGLNDKSSFKEIFEKLTGLGVWDASVLPEYNPVWEDWYKEIYDTRLEYWQLAQWCDKYAVSYKGAVVETPHIGCMGIALGIHKDTQEAFELAKALISGEYNLPTPALNGIRNGDFNTISCCVITGGDSMESIGVAQHIAYTMTAKKAGIGIEMDTRSKGADVKGGRVKHLGKHPIYSAIDKLVKEMTQITRGGSATVTYKCIDPEVENIIFWKTQRVDIETRLDKLDFSFAYNDAFLQAVIKDEDWYLFDLKDAPVVHDAFYDASARVYELVVEKYVKDGVPHKKVRARDILKSFLVARNETGRVYSINVTRANTHTPFNEIVRLSNLCQEICLVTKPYVDMQDLYSPKSKGETAFCSLGAINVSKVQSNEDYQRVARVAVTTTNVLIDKAPMMTESMKESIMRRRSIGIGITGLASALYKNGMDYDGSDDSLEFVSSLAEKHYFYLLKASQEYSEETGIRVDGVDLNWLPTDTMMKGYVPKLDWDSLRGKNRANSVLAAHMPTESSAIFCGATNGLYPVRDKVINKKSRKGSVQYICEEWNPAKNILAWDVDNITLSRYYSRVQDFTDQAISADFYFDPSKYSDEKKPISELMKEWVAHAKLGNKTQYYINTRDFNGGSVQDIQIQQEVECESCKL